MATTYYIYAGYYELWISDIKLDKPLAYQAEADTLEDAIDYIQENYDEGICYSESLRDEVRTLFGFDTDDEGKDAFTFYNEQEYKLTA